MQKYFSPIFQGEINSLSLKKYLKLYLDAEGILHFIKGFQAVQTLNPISMDDPEINQDLHLEEKQRNKRSSKPLKAKGPAKKKTPLKRKASKNPRSLKVSSRLKKKAKSIRQKAHKSSPRSIKIRSFSRNYVRSSRGRYAEKGRSGESDKFLIIYIYVPIQQASTGKTAAEATVVKNKKK